MEYFFDIFMLVCVQVGNNLETLSILVIYAIGMVFFIIFHNTPCIL